MGVTKQGRIAVLTNFKEEGDIPKASRSRGGIIKEFLTTSPESLESTAESAQRLVEGYRDQDVGGFSLVLGQACPFCSDRSSGLAVISNRTPDLAGVTWIATGPNMTHGLSNSHYGDRTWPKVTLGEQLLDQVIKDSIGEKASEAQLIEKLFGILSTDDMPARKAHESWEAYMFHLRKSIFIPAFGLGADPRKPADEIAAARDDETLTEPESTAYGTQRQTVILVDRQGRVVFVERSLFDQMGRVPAKKLPDRRFEFLIDYSKSAYLEPDLEGN